MLGELGSYLLLAMALVGPGPRAQAMKGKSSWGQTGTRSRQRGGQAAAGAPGGSYVGGQTAGGPFWGVG